MLYRQAFGLACLAWAALGAPVDTHIRAFDLSAAQRPSNIQFFQCARNAGYGKVVIRGYQQACGTGGRVDPNFLPAYQAARAAGIPSVDAYMFPCTGIQPNGRACKPIQTQVNEFLRTIDENNMQIHRLWLDIEPSSGACNAWNLGQAANFNLAKQWVAAIKRTGLNWGIYANAGQWDGMFPSRSSDIGSDLPLWAVEMSRNPDVSATTRFMGGWTRAVGKQFRLDGPLPGCGGNVDLNSFLN